MRFTAKGAKKIKRTVSNPFELEYGKHGEHSESGIASCAGLMICAH